MGKYINALAEGTRIGPVVLGPAIGQGGEGIVYRAEHDSLGEVAIKEFFPSQMVSRDSAGIAQPTNTGWQARFRKGVKQFVELGRKLVRLDPHQNIIRFHEVIEHEGRACLVMQLVKGHSLTQSIDRGEFDEPARIMALADSLSSALDHLHAAQIHHRDIAPDNILIRENDERVYLVDFNAAKDLVLEISQSREMLVKPGYSPVEQYWGEGDQAATVDIYAASAVLYHAISGKKPAESVRRNDQDPLQPISTLAAGRFPASFLKAIDRGLTVKAEGRPQTAREWRELLGFGRLGKARASATDPSADNGHGEGQTQPKYWGAMATVVAGVVLMAIILGAFASGTWPFNAVGSGDEADPTAVESTGPPAPSQAELDWQAAFDKANPLVPGLSWVGSGTVQLFKSDDFDRATVTPVFLGEDQAKPKSNRKTYVANTFPFGPAAFEKLGFGSKATFYINGDELKEHDQILFQSVSKEFGDVSRKKLTVSIYFSECVSPSELAPAGSVFRSPCLKILDKDGKPTATDWKINFVDATGVEFSGTLNVRDREEGDTTSLISFGADSTIDSEAFTSYYGNCSLKRGQLITLACQVLGDTLESETASKFELRVVGANRFEGTGSIGKLVSLSSVTLSNPKLAED